jgi:hypothetical protein
MWKINKKLYIKEIICKDVVWINLAEDMDQLQVLVNPSGSRKDGNLLTR